MEQGCIPAVRRHGKGQQAPREKFNELYAACHAAEDKLKDLTLKHGKAAKGVARSRAQQENVAPTEKRRDALRSVTSAVTVASINAATPTQHAQYLLCCTGGKPG